MDLTLVGTLGAAVVGALASTLVQLRTARTRARTALVQTVAALEHLPEGPAREIILEIVRQQAIELRALESEDSRLGVRLTTIAFAFAGVCYAGAWLLGFLGSPQIVVVGLFMTAFIATGLRTSDLASLVVARRRKRAEWRSSGGGPPSAPPRGWRHRPRRS